MICKAPKYFYTGTKIMVPRWRMVEYRRAVLDAVKNHTKEEHVRTLQKDFDWEDKTLEVMFGWAVQKAKMNILMELQLEQTPNIKVFDSAKEFMDYMLSNPNECATVPGIIRYEECPQGLEGMEEIRNISKKRSDFLIDYVPDSVAAYAIKKRIAKDKLNRKERRYKTVGIPLIYFVKLYLSGDYTLGVAERFMSKEWRFIEDKSDDTTFTYDRLQNDLDGLIKEFICEDPQIVKGGV